MKLKKGDILYCEFPTLPNNPSIICKFIRDISDTYIRKTIYKIKIIKELGKTNYGLQIIYPYDIVKKIETDEELYAILL